MSEQMNFDQWAILELMGHRRLAGRVTDAVIGGGAFLRIDIPGKDGQQTTQYYSPGSVYCITPTTEEIARAVAIQNEPAPVYLSVVGNICRGNGLRGIRVSSHYHNTIANNVLKIAKSKIQRCRVCGCTEDTPCMTDHGPCYWVEEDLCSACAAEQGDPDGP